MAHLHQASRICESDTEPESFAHKDSFVVGNGLSPVGAYPVASITPVIVGTAHKKLSASQTDAENGTPLLK